MTDAPINHQLEQAIDDLAEYYFYVFKDLVNGNNYDEFGNRSQKVDERLAFKSVICSITIELLK
jgi:hypothetical protein